VRVAAAQIVCRPGDLETNLRKIGEFAERARAAGAELVVFPEVADTGYYMPIIRATARPWSEGAVPALREMARRLSLAIVCGVSEKEGEVIYNSQVFIDARGEIAGSYRKTHLFCAGSIDENEWFTPGDRWVSVACAEFRLGLSICYDLRFPELYRQLATEQKTDVFIVSSAWPWPRAEHLRILAQARAIENQSYLVLANQVGTDEHLGFCGHSAIIDPAGTILAAAPPDREELVSAELKLETLRAVRGRMAVFTRRLGDRRIRQ
jgi:omega-amidase